MALVVVKTSKDEECINTKGQLQVYHLDSFSNMGAFELGGQPDSIALSPDGRFAAIAIENERNEEFDDGNLPQLPAGYLAVFNLDSHNPQNWTMDKIELTGLSGVFTEDPELEYVSINNNNIAAITLQENNAIVLVDLANKTIINHFSAGHVDLTKIDASEKKPLYINLSDSLNQIPVNLMVLFGLMINILQQLMRATGKGVVGDLVCLIPKVKLFGILAMNWSIWLYVLVIIPRSAQKIKVMSLKILPMENLMEKNYYS